MPIEFECFQYKHRCMYLNTKRSVIILLNAIIFHDKLYNIT